MVDVERDPLFLCCVWVPLHSVTPQVARVEGKKVVQQHVPQLRLCASRPPIFWFANKLLCCVNAELEGGKV